MNEIEDPDRMVEVRVRPDREYELRDVRIYCQRAGMTLSPGRGNFVTGQIPARLVEALRAQPGVGALEIVED